MSIWIAFYDHKIDVFLYFHSFHSQSKTMSSGTQRVTRVFSLLLGSSVQNFVPVVFIYRKQTKYMNTDGYVSFQQTSSMILIIITSKTIDPILEIKCLICFNTEQKFLFSSNLVLIWTVMDNRDLQKRDDVVLTHQLCLVYRVFQIL